MRVQTCLQIGTFAWIVQHRCVTSARWPRREPPLVPATGDLRRALFELRRERWLNVTVEGDLARVTYGERVREIAKEWGIELGNLDETKTKLEPARA